MVVASPRLFTPQAKGIKTFIFAVGVIPYVALDTIGVVWAIMQRGRKLHFSSWDYHSFSCSGASLLIILFIYLEKCVTCEVNRRHHSVLKWGSICVTWASELFGKALDLSNIELALSCSCNAIQFLLMRGTTPNFVKKHVLRINTFYQISPFLVHILENSF